MENKCTEIKIVPIDQIIPNLDNPNIHTDEQIDRLAKIISNIGFRRPLTVSNLSGFIIVGHGRFLAAQKLGLTELPVIYQDYENRAQEYQDMVADNAIASWAQLDLGKIDIAIKELEPFDLDFLGIKDFSFSPGIELEDGTPKEKELDENIKTENTCPSCGYVW